MNIGFLFITNIWKLIQILRSQGVNYLPSVKIGIDSADTCSHQKSSHSLTPRDIYPFIHFISFWLCLKEPGFRIERQFCISRKLIRYIDHNCPCKQIKRDLDLKRETRGEWNILWSKKSMLLYYLVSRKYVFEPYFWFTYHSFYFLHFKQFMLQQLLLHIFW